MKPYVSDHALLRYLERTGRVDRAKIEREILCDKVKAAIAVGCSAITVNGMDYVIRANAVVSVWPSQKSRRGINREVA